MSATCPDRDRLLASATTALLEHHELAMEASKLADEGRQTEFASAQQAVSNAFAHATALLSAYKAHVQSHSCGSSESVSGLAMGAGTS